MRLPIYVLLSTIIACVRAYDSSDYKIDLENEHAAHGIIKSILSNRDFGSSVTFSAWESPKGDVYVVPTSTDEEDDVPILGLGYRLVSDDNDAHRLFDLANVAQINEENIVTAGFPFGWSKHSDEDGEEEGGGDDGEEEDGEEEDGEEEDGEEEDGEEEDGEEEDGEEEEEEETNELDDGSGAVVPEAIMDTEDTDVANIEESSLLEETKDLSNSNEAEYESLDDEAVLNTGILDWFSNDNDEKHCDDEDSDVDAKFFKFVAVDSLDINQENSQLRKRNELTSIKFVTHYTTTTVTSIYGITVTKTAEPEFTSILDTNEKFFPPITTEEEKNESIIENPVKEELENMTTYISNIFESPTESAAETSWSVLETWNSYPFTKTENVFDPIFSSPPANINSSVASSKPYMSSFGQYITSTYYGNNTTVETSKTYDDSIYTRTKSLNNTSVLTSKNMGNAPTGYWGSIMGLIFAVCSGVILI